jgi:hypothetical protein
LSPIKAWRISFFDLFESVGTFGAGDRVVSELDLTGIVIIVGNYGSGKTEVAINLAMDQQNKGRRVRVADLDLVNPYFRTREARQVLTDLGVEMILPPPQFLQADLPILAPQVAGVIRQPGDLTILDVGGDGVGATVLATLSDVIQESRHRVMMWQVVNPFRPNTDSIQGCMRMRAAIESASRISVTGWIGNAHLLEDTTAAHITDHYRFMQALAQASGLPLAFITAAPSLVPQVAAAEVACPILPIYRQLVPPWKKPLAFSADRI